VESHKEVIISAKDNLDWNSRSDKLGLRPSTVISGSRDSRRISYVGYGKATHRISGSRREKPVTWKEKKRSNSLHKRRKETGTENLPSRPSKRRSQFRREKKNPDRRVRKIKWRVQEHFGVADQAV